MVLKFLSKFFEQRFVWVGVPVIIQNSQGEILLGKRKSNSLYYANYWGLPGGLADRGEKLIDVAIREVNEEIGVEIKVLKQSKKIYEVLPSKDSNLHTINIVFYAKIISGIPKAKDETSEVKWFKPSEIRKMKLAYTHKEILKGEGII